MKKIMLIMVTLFITITATKAMTYAQAREQALFLTDKMAYELNLTQEQYEAAYEMSLCDWSSDVCSSDLDCVAPPVSSRVSGFLILLPRLHLC